jgi:hypothetical protein
MGAGPPMAIVVIAVNTRVLLQFFPLSLPFALSFFTLSCFAPIRASPPVLGMLPCTLKFDKEKSTYARTKRNQHMPGPDELNIRQFGSGKWFFSCIFAQQQISAPARKECNNMI